ncbi:MAG TPA: hypothetical protein VMI09_08025 [Candidatus Binataceae bacterium]|nr:hypothetical protein [Candidatus Binataceae bacterium]
MKRFASMLIGALFVGAGYGIATAQAPAAPPAAPPASAPAAAAPAAPEAASAAPAATDEHANELEAFHRVLKMHHRMWRRLKQNPAVVKDDSWVGKYPDLQLYFNKYQGSKERFLADPGPYLMMSETKAMHREETRSPGAE